MKIKYTGTDAIETNGGWAPGEIRELDDVAARALLTERGDMVDVTEDAQAFSPAELAILEDPATSGGGTNATTSQPATGGGGTNEPDAEGAGE